MFQRTNFSFQSKKIRAVLVDVKKLETINLYTQFVLKNYKNLNAIDSMIQYLQSMKNIYKVPKINLILVDPRTQEDFFYLKKVRSTIFKRQSFGK